MLRFDYRTLKAEQARLELTVNDLAARCGISNVTISTARMGRPITLPVLAQIADALGCDVEVRIVPRATSAPDQATDGSASLT